MLRLDELRLLFKHWGTDRTDRTAFGLSEQTGPQEKRSHTISL